MFLKNSRYYGLPMVRVRDRDGRETAAVKLRRLPDTAGEPYSTQGHDRLDAMSEQRYRDATRYWHVADANSELEANDLTAETQRQIDVPPS